MANVIAELNRGVAKDRQLHLELARWETDAAPDVHPDGPQGVIDAALDIQKAEIVVGIFWKRFGTPTKTAASGTEHELRAAFQNFRAAGKPRVMIYFKEAERPLKTAEDYEQFSRVLRFREEFAPQGLYWTFQDPPEFEGLVRRHLTQHLLDHFPAGSTVLTGRLNHKELQRRYCQNLQQKFSTIHLFGEKRREADGLDRMADMTQGFIALHLQDWRDEETHQKSPPLDIDALFFSNRGRGLSAVEGHFLLRGLPGSGKTTLLRYLAHRFAGLGATGEKNYLPIYLRCKALDLSDATLEKLIQNQINQNCDSREMFDALCDPENFLENHSVLLFDGLDEIEHAETAKNFAAALRKLADEHPRCKIILASRPLGLSRADYPQFRALAENPFLLSMICYTFAPGDDAGLIERRSELYKNCTDALLRRGYDSYDSENAGAAKINIAETLKILKELSLRFFLWQEADFPVDQVNVMGRRVHTAATLGATESFLDRVQRDTGLLQRDKDGFTFVHRSLWEYFTALALRDEKNLDFVIRHAAIPEWEEVVRLYAGLLPDDNQVVKLITGLWNINRPLALRVTTEVQTPAAELLKPLIAKEAGNQSKLLLIDGLAQSLPLLPESERQSLVQETLEILLIKCEERDCEVIFHAQELLEKIGLQPLQPGGLIDALFDLEHVVERQKKFLADPANHFEWIDVEGGEFWMGDDEHRDNEKPAHRVKLDSFRMAKHPVTNRMLADFKFATQYDEAENLPATGNNWYEAYYFTLWIGGRLPTEAEWEYAARGGKQAQRTQYYFGDAEEELPKHAWFGESGRSLAHAVDEINPRTGKENINPLVLANMLGNVWEWCADWYSSNYYQHSSTSNPKGSTQGTLRLVRGGSWNDYPGILRCARRLRYNPSNGYAGVGFRCAQDAGTGLTCQDAGVQPFTDGWSVHATVQSSNRSRLRTGRTATRLGTVSSASNIVPKHYFFKRWAWASSVIGGLLFMSCL